MRHHLASLPGRIARDLLADVPGLIAFALLVTLLVYAWTAGVDFLGPLA